VNHLENSKSVASLSGTSVSLVVDTKGWDYLSVDAVYGSCVDTSAVASVFTLQAGDSTGALSSITSTYSVAGITSVAQTVAAQSTSANIMRLDFDLRGKPRYLSLATVMNDTAARVMLTGRLGKGTDGPDTAPEKGVRQKYTG